MTSLKNKFLFSFLLLLSLSSYSQKDSNLIKRSVFISHCDLSNYYVPRSILDLDSIYEQYKVSVIETRGIYESKVIEVTSPPDLNCNDSCKQLLVFWEFNKKFYKISGFKINEFTAFFDDILVNDYINSGKARNRRSAKKEIFEVCKIEGYNMRDLYKRYYNRRRPISYNKFSCSLCGVINF